MPIYYSPKTRSYKRSVMNSIPDEVWLEITLANHNWKWLEIILANHNWKWLEIILANHNEALEVAFFRSLCCHFTVVRKLSVSTRTTLSHSSVKPKKMSGSINTVHVLFLFGTTWPDRNLPQSRKTSSPTQANHSVA